MRHPVRDILGDGGPVASVMGGGRGGDYEARPQQLAMAEAVSAAMSAKARLMVEAGTGVGKSFAYLVPAIVRCLTTDERVVISTHTIALQEQLIKKDIPLLLETVGDGAPWGLVPSSLRAVIPVLVKGRGNYLSKRRLQLAYERRDRVLHDDAQRRSLSVIQNWEATTTDGSLATLPPLERPVVWDRVQSDSDNCRGRKCPTYAQCHYQRARRAMETANLLVCNHALFFSDLAMRMAGEDGEPGVGFLPTYAHVVLDEAHTVEDVANDHFGVTLSESRVEHLLGTLYRAETGRGSLPSMDLIIGAAKDPKAGGAALVDAIQSVAACQYASRAFFDELRALERSGVLRSGRITRRGLIEGDLVNPLKRLAGHLSLLKDLVPGEDNKLEMQSLAARASGLAQACGALVEQTLPGSVYWVESAQGDAGGAGRRAGWGTARGVRMKLCSAPIEVGPILKRALFERDVSVVLTSATLAASGQASGDAVGRAGPGVTSGRVKRAAPGDGERRIVPMEDVERNPDEPIARAATARKPDAFAHPRARLGCDDAGTLLLGSPFDFARQCRVIVDLSLPSPRDGQGTVDAASLYERALAARLEQHVAATDGGAFVLFTSTALMRRMADELTRPLRSRALPMLVQGRDGTPGQILARFREDERSVLLGVTSFWQGVDVKGRGLRNVIITKLPFDPPDRPLVEARGELIRERGGDPFRDDALPRAILRFKQGFGRLIRSRTDTGQVVILDPRVSTTGYGRKFLDALPRGVTVETVRGEAGGR